MFLLLYLTECRGRGWLTSIQSSCFDVRELSRNWISSLFSPVDDCVVILLCVVGAELGDGAGAEIAEMSRMSASRFGCEFESDREVPSQVLFLIEVNSFPIFFNIFYLFCSNISVWSSVTLCCSTITDLLSSRIVTFAVWSDILYFHYV